ncbi:MAG: fumarylacetoacetate hydrolase family protein, partial [Chloroflexota bacterium]
MKLAFYNDFQLGVIQDDRIFDVSAVATKFDADSPQALMTKMIKSWDQTEADVKQAVSAGTGVALDTVTLCPPLPRPGQFVCLAGNYIEPAQPNRAAFNAFLKSNTAVVATNSEVVLPEVEASVFHFEPELAIVIGKQASHLSEENALDCVFGYTQFIDGSARGLPGGFFLGKSWHTFAPLGPAIVTKDEVADPNQLQIHLWVNDALKHDFSTNSMMRHVPELLVEVTKVLTLEPGDVVATGTHHEALSPIQDGYTVRLSIENFGPPLQVQITDP